MSVNAYRLVLLSFGLMAIRVNALVAQRTVALAVGARVRVQPSGDTVWRVGRLVSPGPDTLRLKACDTCSTAAYAIPSLAAVEVSVGRNMRALTILRAAFLGALLGAGAGALWAKLKTSSCKPADTLCGLEYLAVPYTGVFGFFIGGAVGSLFRYDDWRPAPIH